MAAESLDAVSLYFRAIKDYPELSREAFNTLLFRANKGDKAAKRANNIKALYGQYKEGKNLLIQSLEKAIKIA